MTNFFNSITIESWNIFYNARLALVEFLYKNETKNDNTNAKSPTANEQDQNNINNINNNFKNSDTLFKISELYNPKFLHDEDMNKLQKDIEQLKDGLDGKVVIENIGEFNKKIVYRSGKVIGDLRRDIDSMMKANDELKAFITSYFRENYMFNENMKNDQSNILNQKLGEFSKLNENLKTKLLEQRKESNESDEFIKKLKQRVQDLENELKIAYSDKSGLNNKKLANAESVATQTEEESNADFDLNKKNIRKWK